jgi:hypothetical protein
MGESKPLSLFWTEQDNDLTRNTESRDPLGLLPIWSARGRELVPHLTEQTGRAEGFQLLVTIYWLWGNYAAKYSAQSSALRSFYMVAEQAFAHATVRVAGDWVLPGRLRTLARKGQAGPDLSERPQDGLLDNQLGNGTWGLYRGAAMRAGLLSEDMTCLSADAYEACQGAPPLSVEHTSKLLALLHSAVTRPDVGVTFDTQSNRSLVEAMAQVLMNLPHSSLLRTLLVRSPAITQELGQTAAAMGELQGWQRRLLLAGQRSFPAHGEPLVNVLRCEAFISPLESLFMWMCSQNGRLLEQMVSEVPLPIDQVSAAFDGFCDSGLYPSGGSSNRFDLYRQLADVSSVPSFLESVMAIHKKIADGRRRAPWATIENGRLVASVEIDEQADKELLAASLTPDLSWRNDYYLAPLRALALQLGTSEGGR